MHSMIKAKKMKKAAGGTVIVLTLAGLTAILGVIGLAIDLGLMFDYKQRAQMAADAGALAAALSPTDYQAAALEMSKANGFENNVGSIRVTATTPPMMGDYTASGNKDKYFEVTVKEEYPTYFLKMIGIKTFPIEVRAVAGVGGEGGYCLTLGSTKIEHGHGNDGKLIGENCKLYFASLDNQGTISADTINKDDGDIGTTKVDKSMPPYQPLPPLTFPDDSLFNCPKKEPDCKNETIQAGCYHKITVKNKCNFGQGAYYISKEIKFENNPNNVTGSGVTFFLKDDSSFNFNGEATLTSGASPDFNDMLIWSKGNEINFNNNSKANLTGLIYAPGVTTKLDGEIYLYTPSGGSGGGSNKELLVE